MTEELYDIFITQDGEPVFVNEQGEKVELDIPTQPALEPPAGWSPTQRQLFYIQQKTADDTNTLSEYEIALEYNEKAMSFIQDYLKGALEGTISVEILQTKLHAYGFLDNI